MGDRVFLLGIGDVVEPAPGNQLVDGLEDKWQECLLSAPGLVGVKQWHIFEAEGLSMTATQSYIQEILSEPAKL
jgi:hypothetical protein